MSQIGPLVNTLKRELKSRGVTYADVAEHLQLSQSSIKRSFSTASMTLERLEQVCQFVDLEISDLVQRMTESRQRIAMLNEEQEAEVVEDPKLLLAALSVLNNLTYEDILATYTLDEHELVQLFATLDRLKIIELLPHNRLRVIVASDFRWIPDGPIAQYFRKNVQPGFMDCNFNGPGEKFEFRSGMLSRAANATLLKKIDRLVAEFNDLHGEDMALPLQERYGSSLLVAFRPWEFEFFREKRRVAREKVF